MCASRSDVPSSAVLLVQRTRSRLDHLGEMYTERYSVIEQKIVATFMHCFYTSGAAPSVGHLRSPTLGRTQRTTVSGFHRHALLRGRQVHEELPDGMPERPPEHPCQAGESLSTALVNVV